MAHKALIGGTAYGILGGRTLIGGTGYGISKGRTLVGGTGYDIAFPVQGTPLSDFAEGTIIKLNEIGSPVEFYVAKHNYESGLNGTGRTLLVRKECYGTCLFGDGNNSYIGGILDSSLNGAYKSKLDASIQSAIGATHIRCGVGSSSDSTTIAKRAVFQLSASELGSGPGYNDGTSLPIAAVLKKATYNGNAYDQWTRSPKPYDSSYCYYFDTGGYLVEGMFNGACGSRPTFTLPGTTLVDADNNVIV